MYARMFFLCTCGTMWNKFCKLHLFFLPTSLFSNHKQFRKHPFITIRIKIMLHPKECRKTCQCFTVPLCLIFIHLPLALHLLNQFTTSKPKLHNFLVVMKILCTMCLPNEGRKRGYNQRLLPVGLLFLRMASNFILDVLKQCGYTHTYTSKLTFDMLREP